MKKFFTAFAAFAAAVAVALCTLAFTGCGVKYFESGAEMTLVIASDPVSEYSIDLSGRPENVKVTELMDAEGIPYTMSGTMITGAGGLTQSGNVYIYLYTSVEKDKDVTVWATELEYKGKTLVNSGVGILDMTVEDGCVVYIGTIVY